MSRTQSWAVEKALRAARKRPGGVYRIAKRYGIAPSTLYRALARADRDAAPLAVGVAEAVTK